jgi:hypothetical protein
MSEENVEVVRRYFEEAGTDLGWSAQFWEEDGDYYPVRKFPEARPCHGREDIARFMEEFRTAWEGVRWTVEDLRPVGDDRVFAHAHLGVAGRASGMAMEGDVFHSFWLRHGRFIRQEDHLTMKGALHALGLSGEAPEGIGSS